MATLWQSLRPSATGTGTADYDALYDEERLESEPASPRRAPRKFPRFARLRKAALCLFLIDVMLVGLLVHTLEPLITLLRRNDELFPLVTLPHPDTAKHPDHLKIPRILHQTCANSSIPQKWVDSQQSCKESYSAFEYKLWTDQLAREFIAAEYPWFSDAWDNYAFPIQRADSIRYLVLHHYGGIYLDMDTFCNETFPMHEVETGPSEHIAILKSTAPTGVTNDFMISSARHPAFAEAVRQLLPFYKLTRFWARLQPYANIMMSSGPLFITLAVQNYLLKQPSLPSPTIQVMNQRELTPYITDLESSTWHQADAKALMWIGLRPWTWFALGAVVVLACICLINYMLLAAWEALVRKDASLALNEKQAKLA